MSRKLLAAWVGMMIVTSAFAMLVSAEGTAEVTDLAPSPEPVKHETVWAPDLTWPRDSPGIEPVTSEMSADCQWQAPGASEGAASSLASPGTERVYSQMMARPGSAVSDGLSSATGRTSAYSAGYGPGKRSAPIGPTQAYVDSVLLVHADDGDGEPIRSQLDAYPDIGTVDIYNARSATPDLATLSGYEVVFTWSNYAYFDRTAMGNVLADYVDAGGRVVQSTFDWVDTTNWGLGGRFVDEGYSPLVSLNTGNHFSPASLGWYDAAHPLMAGVTAASDGYRDYTALDPGATLVASWDDGENYVAVKGNVVAINSYFGTYFQHTGDGPLICHNAVIYAAAIPTPWFDDMESGQSGWSADGFWHQVTDSASPYPEYHSYETSWWYGQDATGDYDNGTWNYGLLETPLLELRGSGNTLIFWEWYETEGDPTNFDQRWILVDDGSGWQNLEQLDEISMNTWEERAVDLSAYDGQTVKLGFYFDTVDGDVNMYRGWYIDDVLVAPTYCLELGPEAQRGFGQPGDDVAYLLAVTNEGMNADSYDLSADSVWPVNFYDIGTPSPWQMSNPSFESGDFTGWDNTDLSMPFSPLQVSGPGNDPWGFFFSSPTDGLYSVQTGFDGDGPGHILVGQEFIVPFGDPVLMFDYRAGWDLQMIPAQFDRTFSVNIEPSGGGPPLDSVHILTASANTYVQDTSLQHGFVDLSPYEGTTIYIEFDWWVPETMSGPAFFEMDNIRIVEATPTTSIGPMLTGETLEFMASVSIPGGALPGEFDFADIHATSQGDPILTETVQTETVVPLMTDWLDGFESGWGAWTTEEQAQGIPPTYWDIGNPSGSGPGWAASGSECAGTNMWDAYYPGADISLITPWVQLAPGNQVFSFWTWYDMDTEGDDGGFVEVRSSQGEWTQIWPSYGSPNMDYPHRDAYCDGYMTDAFSGTSDDWEFYEFDLSGFSGQTVQARFHFASSPWWGGDWGWYLDEVYMGAPPQYRVDLMPDFQMNFGLAGTDVDHTVKAYNSGTEPDIYDLASSSVWPVEFWSTPVQTILSEDFHSDFPPRGWEVYDWNDWGDPLGEWHGNDYTGYPNFAGSGLCAEANSDAMSDWWTGSGGIDSTLYTPEFSLDSGYVAATLEFDMAYYDTNWGSSDYTLILIYYDGSVDLLAYYDEDHAPTGPGEHVMLDLTPWLGYQDVSIEFYYYDDWTWAGWWQIDNVCIWGDTGELPAQITSVGPVGPGEFTDFIARVSIPPEALPGESDIALISAESWNDPMVADWAMLATTVPGGILLVDDDGGLSVETYHIDALNENGLPFIHWETAFLGCPEADFMAMFDAVVWTTGDLSGDTATSGSPEDTLNSEERDELSLYLDNGGRLYLSSGGFGWDSVFNFGTGWMNNYLGANPWNGDYGFPYDMLGVPGDPIGDGLDMQIHAGDYWPELSGVWTWNDPAMPYATPPLLWDPDMTGAAMRLPTTTYRTVFTGFDLADVDGQANRALLMQRILDWLLAEDSVGVTPEHQEFAYMPDTTVIYTVEVTNRMALPDTFDLSIFNSPAWNTRIMDETASFDITQTSNLDPGQSFWFTVVVDIPLGASPSEWDLAEVSVASWTNPSISATAETFTQVWVEPHAFDEFEGAFYDFRAFGPGATAWEIGDPSGFGPGAAYSPDNCWGTNLADDYYPEADIALVSHYFTLGLASWSEMSFHHWYDTDGMDGGSVEITADFGQTWTQITPAGGYDWMNWWGIDSFSGISGGWLQEQFDLSPYLGETVAFRMRFMSSPATGGYPGWYIDDFDVDAVYPDRGCLLTPPMVQGFEYQGNSIDYSLTLTNVGTLGNDSFMLSHVSAFGWNVQYLDLGYSPITDIGPLDYGESQTFIVRVDVPGGADPGDIEYTWVYAQSVAEPAEFDMSELFSQVYADILLVDDDLGLDSELWYTDSLDWLDSMGYATHNLWDVALYGTVPSLGDLLHYEAVVWATGNSYGPNGQSLTAADRGNLEQYMLATGNVYLTGDLFWMEAWNEGWTDWLGQWFGAEPADASMAAMGTGWDMFSSTPQTLVGTPGDPVGDGLSFPMDAPGSCPSIWGSYAALDIVDPDATVACEFMPGLAEGTNAVVRMDRGDYRAVLAGFDHSKIGAEPERTSTMAEILSWLVTRDPVSSNAFVDGSPLVAVQPGSVVTLTATVESAPGYWWWNNIEGAVYTVGEGNFPGVPMAPFDGDFDTTMETAFIDLDTTGWPDGQYDFYIYCWDTVTNYETESTAFASIIIDSIAPMSNAIQEGSYWRSANPDTIRATANDAVLMESFDSSFVPTGWTVQGLCTAGQGGNPAQTHYWGQWDDASIGWPVAVSPPYCAGICWSDGSGGDMVQDEWLISPEFDLTAYTSIALSFNSIYYWSADSMDPNYYNDVVVSIDGGANWMLLADLIRDPAYELGGAGFAGAGWNWNEIPVTIDLTPYCGQPSVIIAFHYYENPPSTGAAVWTVDNVQIGQASGLAYVELYFRYSADNVTFGPWEFHDILFGEPWYFSFDWPYGEGYYEFYTIAEDNVGNIEAAPFFADAAYSYETSIPWSNAIQTSPYVNYGPSLVMQADAGNGLSGVGDVELWFRTSIDNSTWGSWTLYSTDAAQPWEWTFVAIPDGYYEFYTRAHDNAGNYEDAPLAADAAWCFDVYRPESNAVQDPQYAWNTGPLTVDAVGYDTVTVVQEDFEGAFPPTGWSVIQYGDPGKVWLRGDGGEARANDAGTGLYAIADSDYFWPDTNTGLRTSSFSLVGASTARLEFDQYYWDIGNADYAEVLVSTDGGGSWTQVVLYTSSQGPFDHEVLSLDAFLGQPDVMVEFHYNDDNWDWYWQVDNIVVWTIIDPFYVDLYYRQSADNVSWGSWMYFDTDITSPWQWNFNWPDGDGYYELCSLATDEWGWEEAAPATADAAYHYDTTNPTVIWTLPPDGAINVPITAGTYRIHFSEPMDTGLGTVTTDLPGTVWTWSGDGRWLNGTYGGLPYTTAYYVNIQTGGFADLAGNFLMGDGNFTFVTAGAEYASATGPTNTGSQEPRPTITYTYGGAIAAVNIYYSNNGGASWTFWGQDDTVDFSWTPTSDLPLDGTYYWCAQADGFEPAPTDATFIEAGPYVYDTTPPSSSVDPIAPYWNNAPILLTATATDALSGIAWVQFFYAYSSDNVFWGAATPIGSDFTFPYTMAFNWPDGEGYYMFYSIAVDVAANLEGVPGISDTIGGYDGTAPTAAINPLGQYWYTTSPLTLTATAVDGLNPVDHVELVYWFSADNLAWGGPTVFASDAAAPWSWDFTYPNGTGYYRFAARAHDMLGNAPAWPPATYDVEVGYDNLNPSSAAIYMPPFEQTSTTLIIQATASDLGPSGLYYVSLYYRFSPDNGTTPWTPWGGFATDYSPPYQFSFNFPDGVGYYQFYSVAVDNAYNEEDSPPVADATWRWNPPAPVSNLNQYSPYWLNAPVTLTATVTSTGNAVDYVELWYSWSLNNVSWGPWQVYGTDYAAPWEWNFDFMPSGEGYYMFFSRGMDVLGNYETPPGTADAFNGYDTTDPASSISFVAPYWRLTTLTLDATATDGLSGVAGLDFYYRFSADNATWGAWSYYGTDLTAPYSADFTWPMGNGYYEFASQAWDLAGNLEPLPGTRDAAYGFDSGLPSSSVNAIIPYWRNSSPATIAVTASDALSGVASVSLMYRYCADNATWGAWTYWDTHNVAPYDFPFTFPSGQGYYEFYSISSDVATNVELAGTTDAACAYDTAAPATAADVTGAYWRTTSPITITATGSDGLSGLYYVNLWVRYSADNATWGAWTLDVTDFTAPYSFNFVVAADGYYEFQTRGMDRVGNFEALGAADVGYGYDPTPPSTSVFFSAPYARTDTTISPTVLGFEQYNGFASIELWYRYSADNATWSAWAMFDVDNAAPFEFIFDWPDGEGFYELYSRSTDGLGNYEAAPASADAAWAYDITAPDSAATVPGAYASYDTSRTVDATCSDSVSGIRNVTLWFRWSSDNATWGEWVAFGTDYAAPWSWLFTMPNGTGYYEFYTIAVDWAGNAELPPATADDSCRRRADTNPPVSSVTVSGPFWVAASPLTIVATASDSEGTVTSVTLWYRYSADNSSWNSWSTVGTDTATPWSWDFTFPNGQGYYQFYTVAIDSNGNTELAPSSADASWAYDTAAPSVTVTALPAYVTTATFNIAYTATDAVGVDYVMLYYTTNGGTTWTAVATHYTASPISFTASADGTYGFYVVAYDLAGNHRAVPTGGTVPDTGTTVDTTPPTASGAPAGANITIGTNITVTFSEPVNRANAQAAFSVSPNVTGTFVWNAAGTVMTFVPGTALAYGTEYTVTLDAAGVADIAGNLMSADRTWTFTTAAQPAALPGSIAGKVVDEDGVGIPGATVSIQGTSLTATTDPDGNYAFADVPAGSYTIIASRDGYESGSTAATVSAGTAMTAGDITLVRDDDTGQAGGMGWIIPVLLIALIVAGLLVFMLLKKKKKPEQPDEEQDGEEPDQEPAPEELQTD